MRHAHGATDGALAFPPLPEKWLVVRLTRHLAQSPTAHAWLIESDVSIKPAGFAAPDAKAGSEIVAPAADGNYLTYNQMGHAQPFPLTHSTPQQPAKTVKLTAVGTRYTGSPTFAAFVSDNRNVLSFHDDLADFRKNDKIDPTLTDGMVFSYIVLGWYRTPSTANEPLAFVRNHLEKSALQQGEKVAVLRALDWQWEGVALPPISGAGRQSNKHEQATLKQTEAKLPADLLSRRSLFHGVVAHVNYFEQKNYLGSLLGYPGSPYAHSSKGIAPPTLNIGIGNNSADALIALISDNATAADDTDNAEMWKALEAVLYKQPRSLIESWKEAPREQKVHKSWFAPVDAGIRWRIRAQQRDPSTLLLKGADHKPTDAPPPAVLEPLYDQLEKLNLLQGEVNAIARQIAGLQQSFYPRWWRLVKTPTDSALETALTTLAGELQKQRQMLSTKRKKAQAAATTLRGALKPIGMELLQESADRFWEPTDPVIVIQNAGSLSKYTFPSPLVCRPNPEQINALSLKVDDHIQKIPVNSAEPATLTPILHGLEKQAVGAMGVALLKEAVLVEETLHALAVESVPKGGLGGDAATWGRWIGRLRDSQPNLGRAGESTLLQIEPQPPSFFSFAQLGSLWLKQPWSPLYMDWRITWYPDIEQGLINWKLDPTSMDYRAAGGDAAKGIVFEGRSLMSPQSGRVFTDPIDELKKLLNDGAAFDPQVAKILSNYAHQWDSSLTALTEGGLIGQALTGFHQRLVGRDVLLPRMKPNTAYPWLIDGKAEDGGSKLFNDKAVHQDGIFQPISVGDGARPFEPLGLTPPVLAKTTPFHLLRGGSFRVEALWIVDDFGQWLDLLGGSAEGKSSGIHNSPHTHWPDDGSNLRVAQPPRVLQPARLNFELVARDFSKTSGGHVNSDPLCGWVYHNFLDQALTLCDAAGNLLGELVLIENVGGCSVRWECLQKGKPSTASTAEVIVDTTLRAFADALIVKQPQKQVKLQALLALIDDALATTRPATTDKRFQMSGRPLALVNAQVGLELFGEEWHDPRKDDLSNGVTSLLDTLNLPVQLGHAPYVADGLVGYFKRGANPSGAEGMGQIVAVRQPADFTDQSHYLLNAAPDKEAVRVGFNPQKSWQMVTLLMDPHGEVSATSGIVPSERVSVPKVYLDRARENMELSFRAAPILTHGAPANSAPKIVSPKMPIPLPAGWKGSWLFQGPSAELPPLKTVAPNYQPDYGAERAIVVEGRLLLMHKRDLSRWYESAAGVLAFGGWKGSAELNGKSADELHKELVAIIQQRVSNYSAFEQVASGDAYIELGAVIAFLDHCGIVDDQNLTNVAWLNFYNALFIANAQHAHVPLEKQSGQPASYLIGQLGASWSAAYRMRLWQLAA